MGPGRSETKKEQTGAGAAGHGAKPGRAVVGWCGRSAAGPPAGRAEQAGRGKREGGCWAVRFRGWAKIERKDIFPI